MAGCKWQHHVNSLCPTAMAASCGTPSLPHSPMPTLRGKPSTSTEKPCHPATDSNPAHHLTTHTGVTGRSGLSPPLGQRLGHVSWALSPLLALRLSCRCPESFLIFERGALLFHFAPGPANHAAGPACLLGKPAQGVFPRKSSPASHSLCVTKNVTHSP